MEEFISKRKKHLFKLLKDNIIEVEHIGSTSIPNLSSKPIIDLLIGVDSWEEGSNCVNILTHHHYKFYEDIGLPGRLFLTKEKFGRVTHHIHIVIFESVLWLRDISFRDYLLKNEEERIEYEKIKQNLSLQYKDNRALYTISKNEFISEILKKQSNDYQKTQQH